MITFPDKDFNGTYKLYWSNGCYVGDAVVGDDGYYVWFPLSENRGGYYDELFLKCMYDTLNLLNVEWDEQVKNDPSI